jgi:hypothetical protein
MAFILTNERSGSIDECRESIRLYRKYLEEERERFPPSAHELASSDWYFDFADHRCPHDARLESLEVFEPPPGPQQAQRTVAVRIRLLTAYGDGHIELCYPEVFSYRLNLYPGGGSHRDWRYDEFTVNRAGHVVHTIEWAGRGDTAEWSIEASDVEFAWKPVAHGTP